MKITYLWHSAILLAWQVSILIDPFITWNDLSKIDINSLKPDYILVTHAHNDHLWDTIEIAKNCSAKVITSFELANYLRNFWIQTIWMNIWWTLDFWNLKIKMTNAIHSSSLPDWQMCWIASWFIVFLDWECFYHAWDTDLFYDMKMVIAKNEIDFAFLPIWWIFTMWDDEAVTACEWLNCKNVIPVHYNTFQAIKKDSHIFKEKVEKNTNSKCIVLWIDESIDC